MNDKPENPPAFPLGVPHMTEYQPEWGMSLRDWFAGQALAGSLFTQSVPEWQLKVWFGERGALTRETITAKAAYIIADAMLAERENSA